LGKSLTFNADYHSEANFEMSGTEETFHYTKEDIRKLESRESKIHGGNVPKDGESSILKVSIYLASRQALAKQS